MSLTDFTLAACSDCLQATANGFDGMDLAPDRQEQIKAGIDQLWDEGYRVVVDGDELGFRHRSCDLCNEPNAAGDRFTLRATAWHTR